MNILFVSTSNTCRSPMAAAICEYLCRQEELNVDCDCAGTDTDEGMDMSIGASAALNRMGLDADGHRSRIVDETMMFNADLVLCMEETERFWLTEHFPDYAAKVELLLERAGGKGDIPDPFGGSDIVYDACADRIRACVESLLQDL